MGRRRRTSRALVATAMTLSAFVMTGAQAAEARPALQVTRLARLHNIARLDVERPRLRFDTGLSIVARRHSLRMAREGRLYHSTDLTRRVRRWRYLGENVGVGPSIEDLQQAFMDSPPHRQNILSGRYRDVGVGVVKDSYGTYWVTVIFRG